MPIIDFTTLFTILFVEEMRRDWLAGLATRLIAKITAHLFEHILRLRCRIDIQTFSALK